MQDLKLRNIKLIYSKFVYSSFKSFLWGLVIAIFFSPLFFGDLSSWINKSTIGNYTTTILRNLNYILIKIRTSNFLSFFSLLLTIKIYLNFKNRLNKVIKFFFFLLGIYIWIQIINNLTDFQILKSGFISIWKDTKSGINLRFLLNFIFYILLGELIWWLLNEKITKKIEEILLRGKNKFLDWWNNKELSSKLVDVPLNSINDILNIRKITKNSRLFSNFEQSASNLEDWIINPKIKYQDSLVICLDGKWGSGKTSLMNIVNNSIEDKINNININSAQNSSSQIISWINFSPWSFNNTDELVSNFFNSLNQTLKDKYGKNLEPNLNKYVELITPATEAVGLPKSINKLISFLPFFKNKSLEELKHKINKDLSEIPDKIVIVIDDLDRLECDEIMLVLKLVRQNSDFSNIIFILPFDYQRVSQLISQNRESEYYRSFLPKIANIRLKLNPYSYNDLEGILIASIIEEKTKNKWLNNSKNLNSLFEWYVLERSRHWFTQELQRQDDSKSKAPTLKPFFSFYEPLFNQFRNERSYLAEYPIIIDDENSQGEGLTDVIVQHSVGGIKIINQLTDYLYRPIRRVARIEFTENIRKKVNWDQIFKDLGIPENERDALWNTLKLILEKPIPSGQVKAGVISTHLNNFIVSKDSLRASHVSPFKNLEIMINKINEELKIYIQTYETEIKKDYFEFVKNWMVKSLTPRDIKHLAIQLISNKEINWEKEDEIKEIIAGIAQLQS